MQANEIADRLQRMSDNLETEAKRVDPKSMGGQIQQRRLRSDAIFLDEVADAINEMVDRTYAGEEDYRGVVAQAFGRVRG